MPEASDRPWYGDDVTRSAEADAAAAATSDVGGDPSANVDVPGALWVYLAGPMRGRRDFNAPAFRAAAARLRAAGHVVFCPVERNDLAGFTPDGRGLAGEDAELTAAGFDVRAALGDDLAWITRQAHAVVVLPGWEGSRGAVAEVAAARALGLPVWELDALLAGGEPLVAEARDRQADLADLAYADDGRPWRDHVAKLRDALDEAEQVRDSALAGEDAAERAVARVREACAAVTRDGVPRDVAEYERIKWLGANRLARELLDLTDPHAGHGAGATAGGRG